MIKFWLKRAKTRIITIIPDALLLLLFGVLLGGNLSIPQRFGAKAAGAWVFAGMVLGIALAFTKWRWVFTGLYALIFSMVTAILYSTSLLKIEYFLEPFWVWSETIRLRLLIFFERVRSWYLAVVGGEVINDLVFTQIVFQIAVLLGCAWFCWWFIKRRNPLVAAIPAGGLLGYTIYHYGNSSGIMLAYLSAVALAVGYCAIRNSQIDWDKKKIDWPFLDSLLPEWIGGIVVFLVAVGAAGWLFPIVATPEGWRQIEDALRKPEIQQVANPNPSGITTGLPPPGSLAQQPTEYQLDTLLLDVIGEAPTNSPATMFWVYVSDPPPPPEQAGIRLGARRYYWRNGIFTDYTGVGWVNADVILEFPPDVEVNRTGRTILEQRFEIVAKHSEALVGMNEIFEVSEPVKMGVTPDGSGLAVADEERYTVISWVANPTVAELREAGTEYPEIIMATYLALPDNIPERVKRLADALVNPSDSAFDKANKIQIYLRGSYPYSLDVMPPPDGQDVVDYFLFDASGGFCSYFASAMVVLLRLEGVPARVVTGFANGDYEEDRGGYRVPASAAHAWVEVYFPGLGWVEFEPTPAYPAIDRVAELPPAQADGEMGSGAAMGKITAQVILGAGIILAGVFLAWLIYQFYRLGLFKNKSHDAVENIYWRFRKGLELAHIRLPDSATPREFYGYATGLLAERQSLVAALRDVTNLYEERAYSANAPARDKIHKVKQGLWATIPLMIGLWIKRSRFTIGKKDKKSL